MQYAKHLGGIMKSGLLSKLCTHQMITDDECFEIASRISVSLNNPNEDEKQIGRELIIRVLDNWNSISNSYKCIFADLILAAGFYPYLYRITPTSFDFSEEVRICMHKSPTLENRFFHSEQRIVFDILKQRKNIIISAPTSFGKSMLIEEIVAANQYKSIVIIQPTLALLDETRRKLKKYSDKYRIIVKTSQQYSSEKGNIFLLTAERVLEYQNMPPIELLIMDEFYKLSNERGDNRNSILNMAFVRIMRNKNCKFYMLGPNIDSIPKGFVEKYDAVFYKTNYSLVLTENEDRYESVHLKQGGKVVEEDLF